MPKRTLRQAERRNHYRSQKILLDPALRPAWKYGQRLLGAVTHRPEPAVRKTYGPGCSPPLSLRYGSRSYAHPLARFFAAEHRVHANPDPGHRVRTRNYRQQHITRRTKGLYGSGAMGGTMHIITLDFAPKTALGPTRVWKWAPSGGTAKSLGPAAKTAKRTRRPGTAAFQGQKRFSFREPGHRIQARPGLRMPKPWAHPSTPILGTGWKKGPVHGLAVVPTQPPPNTAHDDYPVRRAEQIDEKRTLHGRLEPQHKGPQLGRCSTAFLYDYLEFYNDDAPEDPFAHGAIFVAEPSENTTIPF